MQDLKNSGLVGTFSKEELHSTSEAVDLDLQAVDNGRPHAVAIKPVMLNSLEFPQAGRLLESKRAKAPPPQKELGSYFRPLRFLPLVTLGLHFINLFSGNYCS